MTGLKRNTKVPFTWTRVSSIFSTLLWNMISENTSFWNQQHSNIVSTRRHVTEACMQTRFVAIVWLRPEDLAAEFCTKYATQNEGRSSPPPIPPKKSLIETQFRLHRWSFDFLRTWKNVLRMQLSTLDTWISTLPQIVGSVIFTTQNCTFDFHSPFGVLNIKKELTWENRFPSEGGGG